MDWEKDFLWKTKVRDVGQGEPYFTIDLKVSPRKVLSTRQLYGIMEFLSDMGGLFGTLVLFGYLYEFIYSAHLSRFYFIKYLFKTQMPVKSQQKSSD